MLSSEAQERTVTDANGASVCRDCKAPRENTGHPTVKPTDLMSWLCRLVCRKGGVVADFFAGSGSSGVAALLEGQRVILIERDPAYAEICRARLSAVDLSAPEHQAPIKPREVTPDFGPLFALRTKP